jgi:5,10-methylenetetrahydromethanopterin reductase
MELLPDTKKLINDGRLQYGVMKFSIVILPEYPTSAIIDYIKTADELGFYAFWSVDEVYHKDAWSIFAAAADKTKKILLGPAVAHVYLREPTLIAQQLATLDELSNGRAIAAISFGNLIMLQQYYVKWQGCRPLARTKEAFHVIRTLLDEGKITYDGQFFKYIGLFTAARPVRRIPLYMGAMGGPRSFRVAGEISDGMMCALGYSREFWRDAVSNMRLGAQKAGRNPDEVDVVAWVVFSVSKNREAAKQVAKSIVGFYIPSMPERQLRMHGIKPEDVKEINESFLKGDVERGIRLTSMDLVDKLSVSGSPEEIVEQLKRDFVSEGVKHIAACIIDPFIVRFFTGKTVENVPDFKGQLKLIKDEIIPYFE